MFRAMRRNRQALSMEQCEEIFERGTSGVLALLGDDGYPYAVPLSYVYEKNRLLFHVAVEGHKLDALRAYEKASFCVIGQDCVSAKEYTTHYRSVIAFGRMRVLESEAERLSAIQLLAKKYAPEDGEAGRSAAIQKDWNRLCMLEMAIEHMTGKEAIELVRQRQGL